jgi:hypothetical protein
MERQWYLSDDCTFEGRRFAHEAEFCDSGKCMRCNDGKWEDIDEWACCPIE